MSKTTELGFPMGSQGGEGEFLCLTICGYKKVGMHEDDYQHHMTKVSAPMTKDLMVKYGIIRWTQIHNKSATRAMMSHLYDPQMAKLAEFDCFSQVVFKSLEDYKRFKQDPEYKRRLMGDHEKFADTKRSMMTIGWITQLIDGGVVVDGLKDPAKSVAAYQTTALITGSFLSGAMMALSLVAVPVFLDTTQTAGQLYIQWARTYHYGHLGLPALSVSTLLLYLYTAQRKRTAGDSGWRSQLVSGLVTVLMVPFTWIIMLPTNNKLFALESQAKAGVLPSGSLTEAQELVTKWSLMHVARSFFPVVGAILGGMALRKNLN
ncbi:hypothetical protein DHEL01_v208530 [Diaporthe helianthi]|uniref:EthD domain-containing protein n=1 Tax=Diaporthe helianthi TaxID=158607 RepID=A0A2P5HS79_DIAHE|nr:hypothetical protein DHEL01_v208530 [Diaporthe helianthi]